MNELHALLERHGVRWFSASELSQVGDRPPPTKYFNIIPTLFVADALRAEFGPVVVTSGYRGPAHNVSVGGAPNSLHLEFNALDLRPRNGTLDDWCVFLADSGFALWGGVGRYDEKNFVHIDTRKLVFRRPAVTWRS